MSPTGDRVNARQGGRVAQLAEYGEERRRRAVEVVTIEAKAQLLRMKNKDC